MSTIRRAVSCCERGRRGSAGPESCRRHRRRSSDARPRLAVRGQPPGVLSPALLEYELLRVAHLLLHNLQVDAPAEAGKQRSALGFRPDLWAVGGECKGRAARRDHFRGGHKRPPYCRRLLRPQQQNPIQRNLWPRERAAQRLAPHASTATHGARSRAQSEINKKVPHFVVHVQVPQLLHINEVVQRYLELVRPHLHHRKIVLGLYGVRPLHTPDWPVLAVGPRLPRRGGALGRQRLSSRAAAGA